jgi:hypothetical protein
MIAIMKKVLVTLFVALIILLSYNNCVRTELAILDVQEFFIKTRTVQAAQVAAERAMRLSEDRMHAYNDLKEYTQKLSNDYQRLSFQAEDAMMKSAFYEQMIQSQNIHIANLESMLRDNSIPIPAQPNLLEPQACPPLSAGNSSNSQRPTNPRLPRFPTSPGGSSPRNWMEPDVSGMVGLREA